MYKRQEQRVGLTEGMATRREVTEEDLQNMKMDLIHLLTTRRIEGWFQHFSECLSKGRKGMKHCVKIDGQQMYINHAGFCMQALWLDIHTTEQADVFNFGKAQTSFSRWIRLPHLLHKANLAEEIELWNDNLLADHNEATTAVLSPKDLHMFCELQLAYLRLHGPANES